MLEDLHRLPVPLPDNTWRPYRSIAVLPPLIILEVSQTSFKVTSTLDMSGLMTSPVTRLPCPSKVENNLLSGSRVISIHSKKHPLVNFVFTDLIPFTAQN
jgi:hypothetical protein